MDAPAFSLPRHNSSIPSCRLSCQTSCCPPPFIWLRHGGFVPPLHRPYDGPYAVMQWGPCSFTIRVGSQDKVVSDSRLKACTEAEAMSGSLRYRGGPLGKRLGSPAATKWVSFADPLVSPPSLPQVSPSDGPGTVFPVEDQFFACPGPVAPSTATVPAPSAA